jgi:APA family basic amino acid/polyamine antiporter
LHPKFATPYYSIIVSGVLMAGLVLVVDLGRVVAISTFALVLNYSVSNLSAYRLANSSRLHRILPLLGVATCVMLLAFILFASPDAWLIGVIFIVAGTVYFLIKKRFALVQKRVLANENSSTNKM